MASQKVQGCALVALTFEEDNYTFVFIVVHFKC